MEQLITLDEARKLEWLPKPYAFSTLWKWAMGTADGRRLKTYKVGRTLCTTESDMREFMTSEPTPVSKPTSDRQRRASHSRAEAILSAAGI